jgi:hypothetical protein
MFFMSIKNLLVFHIYFIPFYTKLFDDARCVDKMYEDPESSSWRKSR